MPIVEEAAINKCGADVVTGQCSSLMHRRFQFMQVF